MKAKYLNLSTELQMALSVLFNISNNTDVSNFPGSQFFWTVIKDNNERISNKLSLMKSKLDIYDLHSEMRQICLIYNIPSNNLDPLDDMMKIINLDTLFSNSDNIGKIFGGK